MNNNIYVINRNPITGQHWRTTHAITDKRIKHIGTAIKRLGIANTAVCAIGLTYDNGYITWANPRLDNETQDGSCSSIAIIERDPEMAKYIPDARYNRSVADIIANW